MPGTTLPCVSCGYDLTTVQGERARCPECGVEFVRTVRERARRAGTAFALSLICWGALGILCASTLAGVIAYLPRASEGSSWNAGAANTLLVVLPSAAIAYGCAVLACYTGDTPARRRTPTCIACAFAFCVIFRGATETWWGWDNFSPWLQVYQWRLVVEWALVLLDGLMVVIAAMLMRRMVGGLAVARFLRIVIVGGAVSSAFHLMSRLYSLYLESVQGTSGGLQPLAPTAPVQLAFYHTALVTELFDAVAAVAWWSSWAALGLGALHIRVLWRASE